MEFSGRLRPKASIEATIKGTAEIGGNWSWTRSRPSLFVVKKKYRLFFVFFVGGCQGWKIYNISVTNKHISVYDVPSLYVKIHVISISYTTNTVETCLKKERGIFHSPS